MSAQINLKRTKYAKLGEARLVTGEEQESAALDIDRESLQQRKLVLESCLAQLVIKKASRQNVAKGSGELLNGKKVADYTSPDVRSVHRSASIKEAGRLLQKWKVGSLLVDDGSRYIGIITDTDLSRKAVAKGLDPNTTIVSACMTKALVTIEDSEALSEAIALMKKNGIRHLPVTEVERLSGCCRWRICCAPMRETRLPEAGSHERNSFVKKRRVFRSMVAVAAPAMRWTWWASSALDCAT